MYDLIVIGSGPAGEKGAAQAASQRNRPAERMQLIDENLKRHHVDRYQGVARFLSPNKIQAGEQILEADTFLIATGSSPHRPPHVPFDDRNVLDSDTIGDGQRSLPYERPEYLRRRRRDRLPRAGVDLNGASPRRDGPRVRSQVQNARLAGAAVRDLHDPRGVDGGDERRTLRGGEPPVRSRPRVVSQQRARADHRRHEGTHQAGVRREQLAVARRAHRRRECFGTSAHRDGRDAVRGTINAFIDSVFNFPTLSEAYKYAAYDGLGNVARRKKGYIVCRLLLEKREYD